MNTALLIGIIVCSAVLGGWPKAKLLSRDAKPSKLSTVLMAMLLLVALVPFSTVVAYSLVEALTVKAFVLAAMGGYTYGYSNELIRLTTFRPDRKVLT